MMRLISSPTRFLAKAHAVVASACRLAALTWASWPTSTTTPAVCAASEARCADTALRASALQPSRRLARLESQRLMVLKPPDVAEARLGVVPAVRAATELTAPHPADSMVTARWKGWARLKAPLRPRTRT